MNFFSHESKLERLKSELDKETENLKKEKEIAEIKKGIYAAKAEQKAEKKNVSWIDWEKLGRWSNKARDLASKVSPEKPVEDKKKFYDGVLNMGEYSGIARRKTNEPIQKST